MMTVASAASALGDGVDAARAAPIVEDRQSRGGPATHGKRRATMSALTLAVFLLGQAAPATAPGTEIRALTVTLLDEKGQEVTDISAADVALVENGVARDITSLQARPPAALGRDPRGHERRRWGRPTASTSWTRSWASWRACRTARATPSGRRGDRPTKVVDHTDDRQAAGDALRRVAPQGGNIHARRLRRGLGRPQEALPRGRPHRGGRGDRHGAGAQLPRQVPRGRGGREERRAVPRPSRSTRAAPTSRCART